MTALPAELDLPPPTLTPEQLAQARELCAAQSISIPRALQQLYAWSAEEVTHALSASFAYPARSMVQLQAWQPHFEVLTYAECVQRALVLVKGEGGQHELVLSDPFDGVTEDWALTRCAAWGLQPEVVLAHADDVQAYLNQQEAQVRAMDHFDAGSGEHRDEDVAAVITLASIGDDANAVVKLVHSTLYDALKLQASDIHLECDAACLHVMYRLDGVLVPITQLQGREMCERVISRVKVMAELDIAEQRVPQDGRFKVRVNGREVDFRVSIMPSLFGEDAVLRLLDRQSLTEAAQALRLDHLGLDASTITSIRQLALKPHGMLLVTGPTGSGKTTTLYAAITEIHTGRDKIITIEDPVEYRLSRVLQIPVNEKKGLSFARGLRSILRHDPDKIMVGEIRDDETAQIAVQAALTGHLVFTTVHANNVFDVLGRFLHMGVDAYSFAAALNGIVAQRLLRMNCPHCVVDATPSNEALTMAGVERAATAHWHYRAGPGCGHCRGTGFKGRKAVAEVLWLNDELRELITEHAPISALKARAAQAGMHALREVALQAVARGETTCEELARVIG
jgi:general secretion pathway protein E